MITNAQVEKLRREKVAEININPANREELEKYYGKVWDIPEFINDFEVIEFFDPLVIVCRKSDEIIGTLVYQHLPRYYWDFRKAENHLVRHIGNK